jgi:hypothetical protein
MGRRIYIIPRTQIVTQSVIDTATLLNCPEIAQGVPPSLIGKVDEDRLPQVWEEPDVPFIPLPSLREIAESVTSMNNDLNNLRSRLVQLESKVRTE